MGYLEGTYQHLATRDDVLLCKTALERAIARFIKWTVVIAMVLSVPVYCALAVIIMLLLNR